MRLKKDQKDQIMRYSEKYNDITANVMRYFAGDLKENMVFSPFSLDCCRLRGWRNKTAGVGCDRCGPSV